MQFAEGLRHEYSSKGILFQCVCPGVVGTNMNNIKTVRLHLPSPAIYVRSALNLLGTTSLTLGYITHSILALSMEILALISDSTYSNIMTNVFLKARNVMRSKTITNPNKKSNIDIIK